MARNQSEDTLDKNLENTIKDLRKQVEELKTNQLKQLPVPRVATDPAAPFEGQAWVNTTSNTFKIRINSVTKTVTLT